MKINEYVDKFQPILNHTFRNALINKRIPHAFLLSGMPGIPLKDIAIYMAKSMLCDNPNPLADLECNTCKRIDNGEYPDLAVFDSSVDSIKKEDVENIIAAFSKTALEKKGIMIYIIHLVETMNDESINSLLKFLEEPVKDTYAILTTENDAKVLPTIISRCQTIRLTLRDRNDVKEEAIQLGVNQNDAEILSTLYNDANLIKEISSEKEYKQTKSAFEDLLNSLEDYGEARFSIENVAVPNVKGKPALRLFFDMVTLLLQDISNKKIGNPIKLSFYDNIITSLTSLPKVEEKLKEVMILRRKVEYFVHGGLLLVHLINIITKD